MGGQTTFNAVTFEELITQIVNTHSAINERLNATYRHCNWAANAYRSEDSALSAAYQVSTNTLSQAAAKQDELLTKLEAELRSYMNETLANEATAENELNQVNETLTAASSLIASI